MMIPARLDFRTCGHRRWLSQRRRSGYTLIELVASLAATSILLAGMGSVVFVAARATDESGTSTKQIRASATSHDVLADLRYATEFHQRSLTVVEVTIADRNGDSTPDKVRYAWSGTPGDPLTRQFNSSTAADYLEDVHFFKYADHVETVRAFDGTLRHCVYQSDIWLQAGDDPSSRIVGSAKTHNAPEVSAP